MVAVANAQLKHIHPRRSFVFRCVEYMGMLTLFFHPILNHGHYPALHVFRLYAYRRALAQLIAETGRMTEWVWIYADGARIGIAFCKAAGTEFHRINVYTFTSRR